MASCADSGMSASAAKVGRKVICESDAVDLGRFQAQHLECVLPCTGICDTKIVPRAPVRGSSEWCVQIPIGAFDPSDRLQWIGTRKHKAYNHFMNVHTRSAEAGRRGHEPKRVRYGIQFDPGIGAAADHRREYQCVDETVLGASC